MSRRNTLEQFIEPQEEKEIINDIVVDEPPPFIEEEKEIISDPVVEEPPKIKKKKKKPFKPPPKIAGEHGNAYNARIEHFRKVYDGEEVTEWAIKRYGTNPNK